MLACGAGSFLDYCSSPQKAPGGPPTAVNFFEQGRLVETDTFPCVSILTQPKGDCSLLLRRSRGPPFGFFGFWFCFFFWLWGFLRQTDRQTRTLWVSDPLLLLALGLLLRGITVDRLVVRETSLVDAGLL